jgi:translocation and assembly module TamB
LSDPPTSKPRANRRKILFWVAGIVLVLPVALVLMILVVANTGPGRSLIQSAVARLSGHSVVITGLSGRFPDALRLAHAEIRDARGAWLTMDGVVLDWSPLAVIGGTASIARLSASRVDVARLPAPSAPPARPSDGGFSLPVRIDLEQLQVGVLDIGAPIAGHAASLRVDGSGHVISLNQGHIVLSADRIDGPGTYRLQATLTPSSIIGQLTASEPAGGLVSGLAKLPDLGALTASISITGPRTAEQARFKLTAGQLKADATGSIDLPGRSAALDVTMTAPAMAPRPDISWGGITLAAHVNGPFTKPNVTAHAVFTNLAGGGASIATLTADAQGNRGTVDLHSVLTGLRLPPPEPDLFTAAPLDFTLHAVLDTPSPELRFTLAHPILTADGSATLGHAIAARIHTVVPDLAPLAAIGNVDLHGHTEATASMATYGSDTDVRVDGTALFTGGQAPVPTLLGATTYGVTATITGPNIAISRAVVDGAAAHASVTGTDTASKLDLAWQLALTDLAKLSPQVRGVIKATGHVTGPQSGLAVDADISGDVGTRGVPRGPITLAIRAQGLPGNPFGSLRAQGRLAGAPLTLAATADRQPDGALHAVLTRSSWKSLAAEADLLLPKGAKFPIGSLSARMTRLADLAPLTGQHIEGALVAHLTTTQRGSQPEVKLALSGTGLAASGAGVAHLSLTGSVRDPVQHPDLDLALKADGLAAPGNVAGSARLAAAGRLTALDLRSTADLTIAGAPATAALQARLDMSTRRATLSTLQAAYRGENLALLAPARLSFAPDVAVDHLSLALGQASLDIAGRVSPRLALTASLRHVTPDLVKPFDPSLHAAGLLTADARLTGTLAAPAGTLRVQATGLRLLRGPAAAFPAGSLLATIGLDGHTASIDARVQAGPRLRLAANGTAPLQAGGALALQAAGRADLAVLDPILGATGQRAAGILALNATIGGTTTTPQIGGTATLTGGEIQDFVRGVRLSAIAATLAASGDTVRIQSFSAKAGDGTIGASGSVGVFAAGVPVDLHLTARNARPLTSDLLTATLNANLSLTGQAEGALDAAGTIEVQRATINIPDALPPSVAVLNVRRPGQKPPPPAPPAPAATVRLAITVNVPGNIFVRGHGLDAELGGKLTVGGTSVAPQIGGSFTMNYGTFSIAGTTLSFSKGEIGFDGAGISNKIDPTLDFVADSTANGVTATLTVGGYADGPTITLSSVPDLPQDEILAELLFGTSVKNLSTVQIAEIAAALAELSGATGSGDPLAAVRNGLGLDRLSVGSSAGTSSGATIEGGRYVARGVFIGAKQITSGGTAAELQVNITKRLKAEAQLSTGGGSVQGATPDNDPGSTIGLSYGFDY